MFFFLIFLLMNNLFATNEMQPRDPFSFANSVAPAHKTAPIEMQSGDNTSKISINKKTSSDGDDWRVKKNLDEKVILENKDGSICEISFEYPTQDEEKMNKK